MTLTINGILSSIGNKNVVGNSPKEKNADVCTKVHLSISAGTQKFGILPIRDHPFVLSKIIKEIKSAIKKYNGGSLNGMESHFQRVAKLHRRLYFAHQSGNSKKTKRAIEACLHSFDIRYLSILRAAHRKHHKISLEKAKNKATFLKVQKNIDEPIRYEFREKENGDQRPILKYGILRTAQKIIVKDILLIVHPGLDFESDGLMDYNMRGGRHAACQKVLDLALIENCTHFVVADIRRCFEFFDHNAVIRELPFPRKVIENVILIPVEAILVPSNNMGTDNLTKACNIRRGLPQGSLTSNLVASWLLKPVLDTVPHYRKGVIYSDNILLGATSESEANARLLALKNALSHSPAGPMQLKEGLIASQKSGFDYQGYTFKCRPKIFGGGFCARASNLSRNKFFKNLTERCLESPMDTLGKIAEQYTENWLNAFPLWEVQEMEIFTHIQKIQDVCDVIALNRYQYGEKLTADQFYFDENGFQFKPSPPRIFCIK